MVAPNADSNANVLLGLLALQSQLISRPDLVAAVRQWVQGRRSTLGSILVERGTVQAGDLAALELLVGRLVQRHDGDLDKALAALGCPRGVRVALEGVGDDALQAYLKHASLPAGPEAAPASSAPPASTSRFRLERLLVEGNLGSLYLGRDDELGRAVVVKQIHERLAGDTEAEARFNREVKYAAELEHTGIVPIYGAGHYADGRRYYAMRYIKGEDLRCAIERCHQTEQPTKRMQQVRLLLPRFAAVCRAIAYAHDRGVLHRDIKPENVMLSADGETIVVDWGLAKSIDASSTAGAAEATLTQREARSVVNPTQPFQAIGTPGYMSPETAGGELDRIGPRSDVYSLGATLYHLLTGQPPFARTDAPGEPLLTRVQKGHFPRPREVWASVPLPLEAICLKAMALLPAQRYRSAQALAEDVEHWLAGEPVSVVPARWSSGTSRRLRVAGVTAALLLLAGAIAVDGWLHLSAGDREPEVQALRAEAEGKARLLNTARQEQAALATQLTTAEKDATLGRQQLAAAQRALDDWKNKHQRAASDNQGLKQQLAALVQLRTERQQLQREVDSTAALLQDARAYFARSSLAMEGAFAALRKQSAQPESKEAEAQWRRAYALLRRKLGDLYVLLENPERAESEYEYARQTFEALKKSPALDDIPEQLAVTYNNFAWLLATSPDLGKRRPKEAVKYAKQAVEAQPNDGVFLLTYGIALYRTEAWAQACKTLLDAKAQLSKSRQPDDYDTCLLFLTMTDCRLKDRAAAERWFAEVQPRLAEPERKLSREMERFRGEAEMRLAELKKAS